MSNLLPIKFGSTVNVAAPSTSSQRISLANSNLGQVVVFNETNVTVFIERGDGTVTAATGSSYPVPAGSQQTFTRNTELHSHMAVICATAPTGGKVYFTPAVGA